jgi:hypothetical protein
MVYWGANNRKMGKLTKEKGLLHLSGISSADILSLLKVRHCKDVIVPECKNGETWGARDLLKLDAWVLCRSYSPLRTIGYEIKVSRQDFESDQKWTGYLDLCHEFYFVCPAGLIRATDLPQRAGIIWASKDRLFTKRKAQRIEPDTLKATRLLIYVVMSRSQIVANMFDRVEDPQLNKLQLMRKTVEEAESRKELAFFVKGHVRRIYDQITQIDRTIQSREASAERFKEALARLGIIWNPEDNSWTENMKVENEINTLKKTIDLNTVRTMRALSRALENTANTLEELIN